MKRIILVLLLLPIGVFAQLPLPCLEYNAGNFDRLDEFEGERSVSCLTIQEGAEPNVSIHNDRNRTFHVDEAQINNFFEIKNVGDGEFNIDLNPRRSFDCAWMEPNTYDVPQYEKVEWGLKLPEEIQSRINSWIINQKTDNVQPNDINPFDPDQIRITAKIWYDQGGDNWTTTPAVIDGFYYVPFFRDMSAPDKNDWDWSEIETEYTFRVRWSPVYLTSHRVVLSYWTPESSEEFSAFYFDSSPTNPSKSFVSVSSNGHYFVTKDNDLFFPVGVNFWEDVFNCRCDYSENAYVLSSPNHSLDDVPLSTEECELCYIKGTDDFCASLVRKKLQGGYATKDWVNIRNMGVPLPGFLKLHERIDELKEAGGNSFRMHFSPATIDIEFEKLNNYYDRQYQAWEFDKVLEHCKENDMRIDLCMQIHNAITILKYWRNNWDWNDYDNRSVSDPTDLGWCYWRELGLDDESPLEFFTNEQAIENYKKKVRYIIARWGYSSSIYTMELFSEINNIGIGERSEPDPNEPNTVWLNHPLGPRESLYDNGTPGVQEAVYAWHQEISGFIKDDLNHHRQLLAVQYAGEAPYEAFIYIDENPQDNETPPVSKCMRDHSFVGIPNIDVISYSNYKKDKLRFSSLSKGSFKFLINQSESSNETQYQLNFDVLNKPIILGESGMMEANDCDHESGRKQLYIQPFTGIANSGYLWHGQTKKKTWDYISDLQSLVSLCKEGFDFDFASGDVVPYFKWDEDHRRPMVNALVSRSQNMAVGIISNQALNWTSNNCDILEVWNIVSGEGSSTFADEVYDFSNLPVVDSRYPYRFENEISTSGNFVLADFDHDFYKTLFYSPANLDLVHIDTEAHLAGGVRIDFIEDISNYPYLFFIVTKDLEKNYSVYQPDLRQQQFYPNPGIGELYIKESGILELVVVKSLLGETLASIYSSESEIFLDISWLPNGLYIVETASNEYRYVLQH